MHEIQFAEQDIQTNEDKILELMVNVEAREQKVKAAEAELKAESAVVEKEKKEARELAAIDKIYWRNGLPSVKLPVLASIPILFVITSA